MEVISKHINDWNNYVSELDKKYPNRHKEIHKVCCKNCPSDHNRKSNVEDLESKDFKETMSKEQICNEVLFVCAWRNSKLCKGICDYYGIDQKFIDKQNA